MKQGTLINRIVMLLLLAAVLVYLGVSAWRSFRDPYTLVLSYAYTVDDSLEATGFLVREERVLASPGRDCGSAARGGGEGLPRGDGGPALPE